MFDPDVRARNEHLLNGITSKDAGRQEKTASDVNDFLRIRAREDGFARNIQEPIPVTPADFDRQVDTVKPTIVKDVEPNTPLGYSVPFGNVPMNHYMDAPRYRVMFDRLFSYRFTAEVMNLMTYDLDIRTIFNEFMLKDLLTEEDRKYMAPVRAITGSVYDASTQVERWNMLGARGAVTVGSLTQKKQITDSFKGLPSTNRHLNSARCLVNNVFIWDIVALAHEEVGSLTLDLFNNGFAQREIMGKMFMVTIKTDLVGDTEMFQFGDPGYLGDFYILEDVTVSTKTENFMFEMFATECIGGTVKNMAAVCMSDFSGSATPWRADPT